MKFSELATYFDKLEQTSSRLEITEILSRCFKKCSEKEVDKVVYLLLGILAPAYRAIVFNVAEKMMLQVASEGYGVEVKDIKASYKEKGDFGDVAYQLSAASKQLPSKGFSVTEVYNELVRIAEDEGEGSQERKIQDLAKLLRSLDPMSAKFVARIPVGKLRLGFSDKTIIDALSFMVAGDKSAKKEIEKAYQSLPDVGLLASRIKRLGLKKATADVKPVVGIPVMPMLGQRLGSTEEMIEKMGKVAIEPKFDGVRVLIHYAKDKNGEKPFVRAFTRNLNDVSEMFPELQEISKYIKAKEVILDSEGVGIDPNTERIVDFQKTMQRRRKHDIGKTAKEIPLRFQVFDLIYKDGRNYMGNPYDERRKVLAKTISKNKFLVVDEYIVTEDADMIVREHKRRLDQGLEGVFVKRLDSKYVPGRTGYRWVKMKEVEGAVGKLPDTVDCIVMGYTRGKGKRATFGVGQFLAGVSDGSVVKSVTKVGTGLTDEQFKELNKRLKKLAVSEKPEEYKVIKDLEPDYWVKPSLIVELAADEITKSPRHTSGYALRFPRLVKFRDDKSPGQVTTVGEIRKLFKLQKA